MKLTFLGAAHEVTGSCTLLENDGKLALIDCGMEQGADIYENAPLPVPVREIDYVFLTHAHIDHSGNLPLLYKNGFRGTVYATKETCNLCDIMLRDSAHIQMMEAEYQTRKAKRAGQSSFEPVYTLEDVAGLLSLMRPCDYGQRIPVNESMSIRFTDIGHLLGSACIEVWLSEGETEKKIVFSGDVGNTDQPIIRDPQTVGETDYLMVESTYGNRVHEARADPVGLLAGYIQETLDKGGNVIIPSFAVGRTQEILYFIRQIKNEGMVKGHDGFPVYVDSPLANEATAVFLQCDTSSLDEETQAVMASGQNPLVFDGLHTYISTEESKQLNFDITPKVIIAASGMCDAGRIRHHLKYNLWRKECLILFVGFQAEGTLGRIILEGAKTVKLFGDQIAVKAQVAMLPGVSGHADNPGLLRWIGGFTKKPEQIFVNHGDDEACEAFAGCLREERGFQAFAPYSGTVYDLKKGEFIYVAQPVAAKKKAAKTKQNMLLDNLLAAIHRLFAVAESCGGMANRELLRFTEQVNQLAEKWRK